MSIEKADASFDSVKKNNQPTKPPTPTPQKNAPNIYINHYTSCKYN